MRKEGLFLIATGIVMLAVAYASTLWEPTPTGYISPSGQTMLDETILGTTVLGTTVLGTTLLNETVLGGGVYNAWHAPAPPIFTGLAVTFIIVGTVLIVHAKVRDGLGKRII